MADVFHEAESKYMFGFTDGSDIGNEGEKAFEYEVDRLVPEARRALYGASSTSSISSTC